MCFTWTFGPTLPHAPSVAEAGDLLPPRRIRPDRQQLATALRVPQLRRREERHVRLGAGAPMEAEPGCGVKAQDWGLG